MEEHGIIKEFIGWLSGQPALVQHKTLKRVGTALEEKLLTEQKEAHAKLDEIKANIAIFLHGEINEQGD